MDFFSDDQVRHLIHNYGYWGLGAIVGLESLGLPLPGETALIMAAIYAGTHPDVSIVGVIGAAVAGAVIGDNIGYWIGQEVGYRLVLRWGRYIGLTERRIKLGQYLFQRHGSKVVFFGRFIPILRVMAAFLAGTNRMNVKAFVVANAVGAIAWATLMGTLAFKFGKVVAASSGTATWVLVGFGVAVLAATTLFLRSHEEQLAEEAERALPGPLRPPPALHSRHARDGAARP
jgi:membrane protein DedA with SNARE-associated domain